MSVIISPHSLQYLLGFFVSFLLDISVVLIMDLLPVLPSSVSSIVFSNAFISAIAFLKRAIILSSSSFVHSSGSLRKISASVLIIPSSRFMICG